MHTNNLKKPTSPPRSSQLYQAGYISYPRTETEIFKPEFDVRGAVEVFRNNNLWGTYARSLLDGGKFQQPRNGRNDDNAHPPIIPVKSADPSEIPDVNQRKVYELVTKHFLACCSMDAKGQQTVLSVKMGTEEVSEARRGESRRGGTNKDIDIESLQAPHF